MARREGSHSSGARFRGGGNRARLGGHGDGMRYQGSSTAGRIGGDFGPDMMAFGLTDADYRVGGRRHRGGFGGGGFLGRRGRRGRRI